MTESIDNAPLKSEPSGKSPVPLWQAVMPIAVLTFLIGYGLIFRKWVSNVEPLPLENIFVMAAVYTIGQLLLTGNKWVDVQNTIVSKLAKALPAFFILFSIGLIIASWMICGTIPMLVYYGLKFIHPQVIYLVAFIAPIIFSTLTGTSWGSVGTIGVVIIGIATAMDANLGIVAGAIVGGAYFGDKLSPLSDTTNIASLAVEVDVYDHIHSMLFTTIPAALMASTVFVVAGFLYPPQAVASTELEGVSTFLASLEQLFNFNLLLLLPPLVVLVGSVMRKPIMPTLFSSILVACILALAVQPYSFGQLAQTMYKGFNVQMSEAWQDEMPTGVFDHLDQGVIAELAKGRTANEMLNDQAVKDSISPSQLAVMQNQKRVKTLLNRGGLYELNDPIITAFMVFVFIGAIEHIRAMPRVVDFLMDKAMIRKPWQTISASLVATGFVAALTSNVYATSFIVGDAFREKYDKMKIPRKVLSRSLEDTGTMLETLLPWSVATIFMVSTLGVDFSEYVGWQLLSIFNIVIAFFFAFTGFCCFQNVKKSNDESPR